MNPKPCCNNEPVQIVRPTPSNWKLISYQCKSCKKWSPARMSQRLAIIAWNEMP